MVPQTRWRQKLVDDHSRCSDSLDSKESIVVPGRLSTCGERSQLEEKRVSKEMKNLRMDSKLRDVDRLRSWQSEHGYKISGNCPND